MVSSRESVIRYSSDDVVDRDDGQALKVEIAGDELFLPALTLGKKVIFILDPNKKEIRSAGKKALFFLLKTIPEVFETDGKAIRFITPESDKSTQMIQQVAEMVRAEKEKEVLLDPEMFLKSKTREELAERLGRGAMIVNYSPITKKSNFMGISYLKALLLKQEINSGARLIMMDDVISTGGTIHAIQELLEMIVDKPMTDILTLAVAREGKEGFSFNEDPLTWLYPIFIPELAVDRI